MSTMIEKQKLDIGAIRAELGLDRDELGRDANVDQTRISRIESGQVISRQTALRVFYAINRFRVKKGLPELTWNEDEWNITLGKHK